MTTRDTNWAPGTPCWIELMTSDLPNALTFYREVFGWDLTDHGPETGGYNTASINGRDIGGLGVPQPGMEHPPVWTTYIATDDVAQTVDAITAAGGTIIAPQMDVMTLGVMAVAQDTTGGTFAIWQGKDNIGFGIANEAGAVTWDEYFARDLGAAKVFYGSVFGYTYDDAPGDMEYAMAQVDGNTVAGMMAMPDEIPAQVPSHWRIYVQVDDCDKTVARAVELGGAVIAPPTDTPYGRMSDIRDPQGASISVLQPPTEPVTAG